MPGIIQEETAGRKRKREDGQNTKRRVAKRAENTEDGADLQDRIMQLESRIAETGDFEKGIRKINTIFVNTVHQNDVRLAAAVALCRIFYRLIASERLVKGKSLSSEEREEVDQLRALQAQYVDGLCQLLTQDEEQLQSTALTLLMRIVKAEVSQQESRSAQAWKTGTFSSLVKTLVSKKAMASAKAEFMETFVEEHDDIRYFTFSNLR